MPGSSKRLPAPLQKQYNLLRAYSVLWYGFYAYFLVFQPLYMVQIGIPLSGVLLNGAFSVVLSLFFQNWWSRRADAMKKFKIFIIIGNIFMAFACLAIPFTTNIWGVLLTTALYRAGPNSDSLITVFVYKISDLTDLGKDKSPLEKKYHSINLFSRYRRFGSIGWALALPIMGIIVNRVGKIGINFYVGCIGFILLSVWLYFKLDENLILSWRTQDIRNEGRPEQTSKQKQPNRKFFPAIRDLLSNKSYLFFIVAAFLFSAAAQMTYQVRGLFYNIFAQDNYLLLVLVYSFSALIEWPVMSLVAKYINRIGWETMIVISYLLTALRLLFMPFLVILNAGIVWSYLLQIITGVVVGIRIPAQTFGIYSILDDRQRAFGQSFYFTVAILGTLVGSLIGAGLAFLFNAGHTAFISIHWFAAFIALLAGIFFYKVKQ